MPYKKNHEEIDFLIVVLDQARINHDDVALAKAFVKNHATRVIDLLEELKDRKDDDAQRQLALRQKKSRRVIVEGFSEDNVHDAFSNALEKVTKYFSEHHDVSVVVLGLVELPKGGHRATLEVQVTPIKMSLTNNIDTPGLELKKIEDRHIQEHQKEEHDHMKHMVHEHFLSTSGCMPVIPDHFLINIHEVDVWNMMIEKQFFNASAGLTLEDPEPDAPSPFMVRVIKPEGGGEETR